MTSPASDRGRRAGAGWLACLPELAGAAVLTLSTTGAAYAFAGFGAAVVVAAGWAVACIALLPTFVAPGARAAGRASPAAQPGPHQLPRLLAQTRGALHDATASMVSYDAELRPTLQHLLAARLAERHGVSLYADPAAATAAACCPGPARRRRSGTGWTRRARRRLTSGAPGIPPRTLAAILDRLERL